MDSIDDVQRKLDEGDYYLALNVSHNSNRLDLDLAAERISAAYPTVAGKISNIVQILSHPEDKEIYAVACDLRDRILRTIYQRYGEGFKVFAPNVKEVAWIFAQRLLNCTFEKNQIGVLIRTAESLMEDGLEWAVEDVLNYCLPVVAIPPASKQRGLFETDFQLTNCSRCSNTRYLTCIQCVGTGKIKSEVEEPEIASFVDDPNLLSKDLFEENGQLCENCRGTGRLPCDCADRYRFRVDMTTKPGSVLRGRGLRTGKAGYLILDYKVTSVRPTELLLNTYTLPQLQKQIWGEEDRDFKFGMSIQEVQSSRTCAFILLCVILFFMSWWLGNRAGSWQIGLSLWALVIGIIVVIFRTPIEGNKRRFLAALLLLLPLYGAGIGYLFNLSRAGIIVGAEILLILLAFFSISWLINKKYRT